MSRIKNHKFLLVFIIVIIVALIAVLRQCIISADSGNSDTVSLILQIGELVGVAFTILFTIQQIVGSKEIAKAYNKFMETEEENRASIKWDNVYEARQLRCLVSEGDYQKLLEDKHWWLSF